MRTKALLTIFFSLILGFIIGFFVSQELVRHRVKDVRSMSSRESFKSRTYSILEPTEEQKKQIDPVIEDFSNRLDEARNRVKQEYHDIISMFQNELEPYITREQMERLEEFPKYFRHKQRDTIDNSTK